MSKLLIASLAMLGVLFISCNKEESDFFEQEDSIVELRSVSEIIVYYLDGTGKEKDNSCQQVEISYVNSTSIEMIFVYENGSNETILGSEIKVLGTAEDLQVLPSQGAGFVSPDFDVDVCGNELCYTSNNGNSAGVGLNFIIEEEPGGF